MTVEGLLEGLEARGERAVVLVPVRGVVVVAALLLLLPPPVVLPLLLLFVGGARAALYHKGGSVRKTFRYSTVLYSRQMD